MGRWELTLLTMALVTAGPFLTYGLGHREFGEPCEPPRSLVQEPDGRINYAPGQQRPYTERSPPYGQNQGGQYYEPGQGYRPYPDNYAGNQRGELDHLAHRYDQLISREVNETRRCRSERGLRCDPYTRSCKCFEVAGASWSIERERCEFKELGTFCSARITEYAQYCTEFAECTCNWDHWDRRKWYPCDRPPTADHHTLPGPHAHDTNNGKCLCQVGYRAYDDNSGCWYSRGGSQFSTVGVTTLLAIILVITFLTSMP